MGSRSDESIRLHQDAAFCENVLTSCNLRNIRKKQLQRTAPYRKPLHIFRVRFFPIKFHVIVGSRHKNRPKYSEPRLGCWRRLRSLATVAPSAGRYWRYRNRRRDVRLFFRPASHGAIQQATTVL